MRLPVLALTLSAALLTAGCDSRDTGRAAADPSEEAGPAAATRPSKETGPAVTRAGLAEHLRALQRAADEHGGNRAAGTGGDRASVAYVTARLKEAGWRVTTQPVRFPFFRLRGALVHLDGRRVSRGSAFRVISYSGSGAATGRLRRVGDGCQTADFRALSPREIPLAERGRCFFRVKGRNAERAGARALVVEDRPGARGVAAATLGRPGSELPVVIVAADAGARGGARATVRVGAVSEQRTTQNVIAETPGGPAQRVLMAGAHLDSVSEGPGINDNGTGVATLLEMAEAVGPTPPGARVRLAFWGAEELGLIGSRRYVRSLDAAGRRQIAGYLNFDMVGSPNAVNSVYSDGDPRLEQALRDAAGVRLADESIGGGSDHASFDRAGIPVGGLFTGASDEGPGGRQRDPCYHQPCDDLGNVDRAVLLKMARAAATAVAELSRSTG